MTSTRSTSCQPFVIIAANDRYVSSMRLAASGYVSSVGQTAAHARAQPPMPYSEPVAPVKQRPLANGWARATDA
jgi:hypothetical protein